MNRSNKSGNEWITIYRVIGYEGITSEIYGYGNNPEESLAACSHNFDLVQKKYNESGEKILGEE